MRLSAACPLAITMMPGRDPASYPPFLDAVIQSSRHWQQLELNFRSPHSILWTRLLSLSPDDLCMLRELRISLNGFMQEDLLYQSGLLTAQGLRSFSIANIQTIAFPAGIPPNWKNLNHLFIHSPIFLGLAHLMLSYCCNLVACLLQIAKDRSEIISNGLRVYDRLYHFTTLYSFPSHIPIAPRECHRLQPIIPQHRGAILANSRLSGVFSERTRGIWSPKSPTEHQLPRNAQDGSLLLFN